ncbi:CHASE domain-containing protein [Thauera sinica]|uniref:CHASE domain-containing protein n=1 Tax=Thauera sinica TaxID=2665146 RepID=A0ABW1AUL4_9RHOO|nr:CHASE domain-containing protein [Thauera sp. K11]ATE59343.1 GGDEF domain-containing protein [Thauera sp. K11]
MPPTDKHTSQGSSSLLGREGFAWLTLGLSTLLTLILWQYSEHHLLQRARDRFDYRADKERSMLISRLQAYEQVLRGGAALFAASDSVTRTEWRAYIDQLQLDTSLPGILGTGFALVVPRDTLAEHERAIRAAGFADYTVQPAGERDAYTSIIYLEPFSGRNLRAFGYDMYSEPIRREAMERARDTGRLALSGKVTLVQETDTDVQPGFLMYMPVYRADTGHGNAKARRAALAGYVYSPFRAHDLMRSLFDSSNEDIEIELFDLAPAPDNLLYASPGAGRAALHGRDLELVFGGRPWIARFKSSSMFEDSTSSNEPLLILLGGSAFSLLLFAVMLKGARHRRRMQAAAVELAQSRDRFQTLVENVPGTVFRTEAAPPWRALHVSRDIEGLTGEPPESFLSGSVAYRTFIHPDDTPAVRDAIARAVAERGTYNLEYRIRARDGQIRWASERGRATCDGDGRVLWIDGVILDVTDRKIAELAIRDLAFYDPLTGLPNRRLLLDRLRHQLAASSRSGLHGALLFVDLDKFKAINDTLGHHAGDLLLSEVAHRLRAGVREGDTVARLGGDEFVVMLEDLAGTPAEAEHKAAAIAAKLLSSLNQPYLLDMHTLQCTPSIGLTTYCGHQATVDELLRRADRAMYEAKAAGSNQVQVFHGADEGTPMPGGGSPEDEAERPPLHGSPASGTPSARQRSTR